MSLRDFFSKRTETTENHPTEALKTHYYKTTKQQAMCAIKHMIEEDLRIKLLGSSDEHGEIIAQYVQPRQAFMVISVIMVRPYRTAVDITVTTNTWLPLDGGFSKKVVLNFYQKVDQMFELAGVGLGENLVAGSG